MAQSVTIGLTIVAALVVVGALVVIGGFVLSMLGAAVYWPIEGAVHHRHHPLSS